MSKQETSPSARVLLVEDHPMFRERLAHLINQAADMQVCGETDNIREAMQIVCDARPNVAVVDISLKGSSGLELIKNLKAQEIDLPVLVLSMHEESLYAQRVLAAGGKGYLTKRETSDTVLRALRCVLEGEVFLSERMTAAVLKSVAGKNAAAPAITRLADRELEVFQLIGSGRTTREIAEDLALGLATVETYRNRIKEKLGLRNAVELQHQAVLWFREQSQGS
jgi:DNA-binding NarL/FixJ family response regulator